MPTTRVHLPTGEHCGSGRHPLRLCFDCGVAPTARHLGDAECCPCALCPCCTQAQRDLADLVATLTRAPAPVVAEAPHG